MIHLFFGYEKNVARTAKALGIQNPKHINEAALLEGYQCPITIHICEPWVGSDEINNAISRLLDATIIYHILEYKQVKNDYNDL